MDMLRLKCYEPAGAVLRLSVDDASRHLLAVGSTGSGKTTALINPVLQQLIANGCGLLVLDGKGDDTEQRVRLYAKQAGREADVVTLSPGEDFYYYEFFAGLRTLDDVDEFAKRLTYGSAGMGAQNMYWEEARFGVLATCLALLLTRQERPLSFRTVATFLRAFIYDDVAIIKERLDVAKRLIKQPDLLLESSRVRLELAVREAESWARLDGRTKEQHRSTLGNVLRPLFAARSWRFFAGEKRFEPSSVLAGKILVCSAPSLVFPGLAGILFRALKRDFFTSIFERSNFNRSSDRWCAMVVDELPLVVTRDDQEALAIIRSYGGFMVGATQGFHALDEAIGPARRAALVNNFNNLFFFACQEPMVETFASALLGYRRASEQELFPSRVCPEGGLTRLPAHHCFAKLASGVRTDGPVWFESFFHKFSPREHHNSGSDDLRQAITAMNTHNQDEQTDESAFFKKLCIKLLQHEIPFQTSSEAVTALWPLCIPNASRSGLLKRAKTLFPFADGWDKLPSCWLIGLLGWLQKEGRVPAIRRVSSHSGVVMIELVVKDPLREQLVSCVANRVVYPSVLRPLHTTDRVRLVLERPDLAGKLAPPRRGQPSWQELSRG